MAEHCSKNSAFWDASFQGKRILVTGATRGIGKAVAIRLSELGAEVFGLGSSSELLQGLKREHPNIHPVQVDLNGWDSTRQAVEAILPIDMLVNNAGVAKLDSFVDATQETYELIMGVNLKAVINISQVVAKSLIERKAPGSIVNVSSICSKIDLPQYSIYCASKGALDALTRCMASELGQHNIRVNTINPTVIPTDMALVAGGWGDEKKAAPVLARTPLRKFGGVDDCANAVVYLLSDQAKYITGVHLPVDGGLLAT